MNVEIKYDIQPIVRTTVKTIKKFSITVSNLKLFTSVDILVCSYDVNNNFIEMQTIILDGADYLLWLNNDQFLIDYVKIKLGYLSL